jgi:serine/threonine-protein kinase
MTREDDGLADRVFGRFRLLELIGEGGMGQVYRAHDTVMGRDVAIKVLPIALGEQPGYRERFRREAHTAARLTEPHIIPIHDAGESDDGHLYLVMPVIDGIDVGTLLKRDGPLSPQRAVAVIEQLAAALDAAHKQGLVHRDVKPSNALLTGDDFVYLIDFGIAHDAAATRLTNTGMMVGTLAYMAPERFTTGIADARADIYALACVLHECLTGDTPFPGNSVERQIAGHLRADPPRAAHRNPAIPAGLDEVIAIGMAKAPEQRYQRARDLATAARHALNSAAAPPHAVAPAPVESPTVRVRPHGPPPPRPATPPPFMAPPVPGAVPPTAPNNHLGKVLAAVIVIAVSAIAIAFIITGQHPKTTTTTQFASPTTTLVSTTDPTTTSPDYTPPPYTPPAYTPEPPPPPPPAPDLYAAIAMSNNGATGGANNYSSLESAKDDALSHCRAQGPSCTVVASIRNGCVAAAWNVNVNPSGYGGSGPTKNAAEQQALANDRGGYIANSFCTG